MSIVVYIAEFAAGVVTGMGMVAFVVLLYRASRSLKQAMELLERSSSYYEQEEQAGDLRIPGHRD